MTKQPKELTEEPMEIVAKMLYSRTFNLDEVPEWEGFSEIGKQSYRNEARAIVAKLHSLGYSSPQEVKDKVEQARGEIGEWLGKMIVRDLDGNRVDIQTRYPSDKDIDALKQGIAPKGGTE